MRRISSIGAATITVLTALAMTFAMTPAFAHDDWDDDDGGWGGDERGWHDDKDWDDDHDGWGDRDGRWGGDRDHDWWNWDGPWWKKDRGKADFSFERKERPEKDRFSWAEACDRLENISIEELAARLPALLSSPDVIFFVKKNDDGTANAIVCHSPSAMAKDKAA